MSISARREITKNHAVDAKAPANNASSPTPGHASIILRTSKWLTIRPEWVIAALLLVLLVATSSRYGYHRDELYFIVAGRHPDWGYPDQPVFAPFLAAALDWAGGGSIVVFRLASSLAAAATVLVVAGIANLLGGSSRARLIAAVSWAVSSMSLVLGHFVNTALFEVLASALVCYCILRAIVRADARWMLAGGGVLGFGLSNKLFIGVAIVIVVLALLAVGPRRSLFTRWSLGGAALAALAASPYIVWQAAHGWPQASLAQAIAAEGAQGGRLGVIPFQFLLFSPPLAPLLIAGIVWLLRSPEARPARAFAIAYLGLIGFVIATGGKAYYATDLLPVVIAAGSLATDGWLERAKTRDRMLTLRVVWASSFITISVIGLAIVPPQILEAIGVQAVNPDLGEEVGWPALVKTVADAYNKIPPAERQDAVVFTANYGEAGAVDMFGGSYGLPPAHSGHNAYALWGPPERSGPVVLVGFDPTRPASDHFVGCSVVGRVDNGEGLDNDEQGVAVQLCDSPAGSWASLWPKLIHYD